MARGPRWLGTIAITVASAAPGTAGAAADPPAPMAIPGGVADASGVLGYFAAPDGTVSAVDLATGRLRWTTRQGRWPLAARAGWLAVAAPDSAQRNTVRVRFLRPTDGKLLADAPVRLPDGVVVGSAGESDDNGVVIAAHNASLTLSASDATAGRLRVSWETASWIPSGFRPSPVQRVSGVAIVDPIKGAVELGPAAPAPTLERPPSLLPAGFKPARGAMYWSWSRHGGGWTDKPAAFRIGPGVVGFLSYEDRPAARLLVNRLRNGESLPPIEIASDNRYAPLVSLDGRYVVLSRGVAEHPVIALYDLSRMDATVTPAKLPPLDIKFLPPYAVIGPRLYFVVESDGAGGSGGATIFQRRLVALDWTSGHVSWTHPLTSRVLPAPTPGAR
jgi:hypothetical protein